MMARSQFQEYRQVYRVTGHWPFPLDMLRHDDSSPVPADAELVTKMTAAHCPDDVSLCDRYQVTLTRLAAHRWSRPNLKRWESFGWQVTEIDGKHPDTAP